MTEILFAIQKRFIAQGIDPYFQLFERLTAMQLTAMSRALRFCGDHLSGSCLLLIVS
jgi:hypothetical protein